MNIFSRAFHSIASFFTLLFGKITWTCPPWLKQVCQQIWNNTRLFWGIALFLCLLTAVLMWYESLPRANKVIAHITVPEMTPLADELIPNPLIIDFNYDQNSAKPLSAAALALIGKDVTASIHLSPDMPGSWTWENDNRLVFNPDHDWPSGQKYKVHFSKNIFSKNIPLKSLDYSFTTLPFQATIADFKFYQDPINPEIRAVVATIHFNYPVDAKSLENHTQLSLQTTGTGIESVSPHNYHFTITYDKFKRTAYFHSEPLALPSTPQYLELTLKKGISALTGTSATTENRSQTVLLPDALSFFKIENAAANIVRNDKDQPEQLLTIETTVGVTENNLNKNLHVYILPEDRPATAAEESKPHYAWQNPGEITDTILALSTPFTLEPLPADRDYATLHSYRFNIEHPGYLYIKIDKGTKSFGDFELANSYTTILKIPQYPKEIGFLHKGSLLSLSGEKKLSVTVRGLSAVKFSMARVLPDDINHLVTQTEGSFSNPQFLFYHFNRENISEIFNEIREFNADNLAKQQYTALDLGKYLSTKANSAGPLGLFLLEAKGWDSKKSEPINVKANRLILITDLGLLVKDNKDGSHDVFVQSISQGKPVANASISVLGKNGLAIATSNTNAVGYAHFNSLEDYSEDRLPIVYLAKLGSDVSFIPYKNSDRELNFSRFDVGGVVTNEEQTTLSAYLFSDRGIYRPGDTAHLGIIVKKAYAVAETAGLPLQLTITDPRGTTLLNKNITLDSFGYLTADFMTTQNSPTGQYIANLFIVKDNHPSSLLGSTTFKVAEFLPDRMHIKAQLSGESPAGWISPNELTGTVDLTNLYGTPAADRKISARLLLSPQTVEFNTYKDYIFIDPLTDPKKPPKVFTETLTDVKTDAQGKATFPLHLERFDKATYQLTFFAEGFEAEGGRSVTTQTTALVSPLSYLVGYKTDGDLSYIKQNSQRNIHFIAVNPALKQIPVDSLTLQIFEQRPITTLVKNDNGTYQYQSLIQSTEINKNTFSIEQIGQSYALPTDKIGDFIIKVFDHMGTELSHVKFTVVGQSQQPLPKNAELSIKLNKTEFLPDQDIEMEITAPYAGSGLITIERDRVYAYQWFHATMNTSLQKIHIPKEFQGGGYVNVTFVRDWNSPEIFLSPLSYSTVPFTVNKTNHTLTISLKTPEIVKPGTPLTIQYQSDKPGKIIIFAIDEGILQVTKYQTPDPLQFFFQKRALEVTTRQILDQILPKFIADRELSAVGGDNGEGHLGKYLNPFKRKTDLPVVYWSGILDTDQNQRTLSYRVPDYFNGTLRIVAVAVSENALGATEKETKVKGDFIINPNIPTFVAPGDTFEITASIANNLKNSGSDASIAIDILTSPHFEILGSAHQTLKISEGKEASVRLKLRAKPLLGSATITIVAGSGGINNRITSTLSIRPTSTYLTTVNAGYSNDSTKSIKLARNLYPQNRQVETSVSQNPLILVYGLERYLSNYPYGCTEQLISKAFPLLALTDQAWYSNNTEAINNKVVTTVQMLAARQLSNGGFSYWPDMGNNSNNSFASVYAMHFLTEARSHGFSIPKEMFSNGIGYLKDLSQQSVTNLNDARIKAYAIYILTRNEIITTNYLTNLQLYLEKTFPKIWHHDITNVYMASTYMLLKNYPEGEHLLKTYYPNNKKEYNNDFYNDSLAAAQYIYLLARHFPDVLAKQGDTPIQSLLKTMNSDEMNTILSSYTGLALASYAKSQSKPNNAMFTINALLADNKKMALTAAPNSYQHALTFADVKLIELLNPNKQYYFYQVSQSGFDKDNVKNEIQHHLEITREYRNNTETSVYATDLGQELEVHIRLRSLDNQYYNNIAIVDLLPGGFEPVDDSINRQTVDYVDVREDRIVTFTAAVPDVKEIVYKIKATNNGQYSVPAITATSMYDPTVLAKNGASTIEVK